jgi:hypothetical protein
MTEKAPKTNSNDFETRFFAHCNKSNARTMLPIVGSDKKKRKKRQKKMGGSIRLTVRSGSERKEMNKQGKAKAINAIR